MRLRYYLFSERKEFLLNYLFMLQVNKFAGKLPEKYFHFPTTVFRGTIGCMIFIKTEHIMIEYKINFMTYFKSDTP